MNAQLESPQRAARWIKIGADSKPLPESATYDDGWEVNACRRTGLMTVAKAADLIRVPNWHKAQIKKVEEQLRDLRLGGFDDWRLTTGIEEEFQLWDRAFANPALDPAFFIGWPIDWFWTKTMFMGKPSASSAWVVYSSHGNAYFDGRDGSGFVRAVRGGQ